LKYKVSIFFIIGFTLYLIDVALNNYDDKEIYISDQEIISLVTAWKSKVGRNPNDDEITRIINNLVEEEILYREALKLGLDKEDRIIKRRLAQKISFLKQESIPESPSNQDLIEYFNKNNDKYFIDPTYTFSHYFFSSENISNERASKAYSDLLNNIDINSDPFFLGKNFVDLSVKKIEREFGKDFSTNFVNVELNKWVGPIKSPFGHHIIYVTNYTEGYLPDITNVLKQVEVDFLQDQRDKAIENYLNKIRSEYKIYINPELQI
tara:strand:- start:354 stop:1148 length:795 start_codon:yes stop_codon:yes gene_type:complete